MSSVRLKRLIPISKKCTCVVFLCLQMVVQRKETEKCRKVYLPSDEGTRLTYRCQYTQPGCQICFCQLTRSNCFIDFKLYLSAKNIDSWLFLNPNNCCSKNFGSGGTAKSHAIKKKQWAIYLIMILHCWDRHQRHKWMVLNCSHNSSRDCNPKFNYSWVGSYLLKIKMICSMAFSFLEFWLY